MIHSSLFIFRLQQSYAKNTREVKSETSQKLFLYSLKLALAIMMMCLNFQKMNVSLKLISKLITLINNSGGKKQHFPLLKISYTIFTLFNKVWNISYDLHSQLKYLTFYIWYIWRKRNYLTLQYLNLCTCLFCYEWFFFCCFLLSVKLNRRRELKCEWNSNNFEIYCFHERLTKNKSKQTIKMKFI